MYKFIPADIFTKSLPTEFDFYVITDENDKDDFGRLVTDGKNILMDFTKYIPFYKNSTVLSLSLEILQKYMYIRRVEKLEGMVQVVDDIRYGTSNVLLSPKQKISDVDVFTSDSFYMMKIKANCQEFKLIPKQNMLLCYIAIKLNGELIKDVVEQTKDLCLAAVKTTGMALQYVRLEWWPELIDAAIVSDAAAFKFVANISSDYDIMHYIDINFLVIKYVKVMTNEMKYRALEKSKGFALCYIKDADADMRISAIKLSKGQIIDNFDHISKEEKELILSFSVDFQAKIDKIEKRKIESLII